MNFQEKLFETSAELRSRAQAIAASALQIARQQADVATKRVEQRFAGLKGSIAVLNSAGSELNKVASRHARRFVEQNSTLAAEVGNDVSALARSTFATLTRKPVKKARRVTATRKRARKAA
jgi:methionine synthase I (cobalamin-dependent)